MASGPKGVVLPARIGFGEHRIAGIDGNDGYHTSTLDCVEGKGGVGEVASSHVRSVLIKHVQTRYIANCTRGFCN